MPGTTPVYGFPYQVLGDSPNGAQGLQDLATEVEAEFIRKDTGMAIFTQSTAGAGNFAKPTSPAAKYHRVRLWGGGGAGGGVDGQPTGQGEGGGGGSGAYVERWYLDSELAASEPWVVGAGGAGVVAGAGGAGANSTFKGLTAAGGAGGLSMVSTTGNAGANQGNGGTATGGHLNADGGDGGKGRVLAGQPVLDAAGGQAPLGGGSSQFPNFGAGTGTAGASPGGGGSGAYGTTADFAGGAGAAGKIEIVSFF